MLCSVEVGGERALAMSNAERTTPTRAAHFSGLVHFRTRRTQPSISLSPHPARPRHAGRVGRHGRPGRDAWPAPP